MIDPVPQLAPDIEWMLLSRQVSDRVLLAALVEAYYPSIYQIALCLLADPGAARAAAEETFSTALLSTADFRAPQGPQTWLFALALKICRQRIRRPGSRLAAGAFWRFRRAGSGRLPGTAKTIGPMGQVLEALDENERLMTVLHYGHGWEASQIGALLLLPADLVEAGLENTRRRVATAHQSDSAKAPWPGSLTLLQAMSAAIRQHWPPPPLPAAEIGRFVEQIGARIQRRRHSHRMVASVKESLMAGVIILVVSGLIWQSTRKVPTAQPTPPNPSPADAVPNRQPLTLKSSSAEIKDRLTAASRRLESLWADVNINYYGPPGYVGPPLAFRYQVWLRPDQSLVFSGALEGDVDQAVLSPTQDDGRIRLGAQRPWISLTKTDYRIASSFDRIPYDPLDLTSSRVSFKPAGTGLIAGREALVVDQIISGNQRVGRLWLDTLTGLVLRQRLFGGRQLQDVISDASVTAIAYDRIFPPEIYAPAFRATPRSFAQDHRGGTGQTVRTTASRFRLWPLARETIRSYRPPITNFNPARSPIDFQFPPSFQPQGSGASQSFAALFAEGYYLGRVEFADPFSALCDRSPDGLRIAYTNHPNGTVDQPSPLYWFQLSKPESLRRRALGIEISLFAFAPDSRRLAVFGSGKPLGAIYILDSDTATQTRLMNLESVRSLVWSPSGEFLALIGTWESPEYLEELMVVNAATGEMVFHSPYQFPAPNQRLEWPSGQGKIVFPDGMGGLEACAATPLG